LILQNHYFFEKQSIFSSFSQKTTHFSRIHLEIFSIFRKNTSIFTPITKKSQILIFQETADI